jgi:hypothetical protein
MVTTATEMKATTGAQVLPVIWLEDEKVLPFRFRGTRAGARLAVVWGQDELRPALRRRARRVAWHHRR